jgi:DNA-3-methyladenine glycosylase I
MGSELMMEYHDIEWGVPLFDDHKHFEFLTLESAQAGLSWATILKKRENYQKAYDNFDLKKIAHYGEAKKVKLLADVGIVRNQLKIYSSIINAQKYLEIQNEFGSYSDYVWAFVNEKPVIGKWKSLQEIPAKTELSDKISLDMKKRGFKFLGSTTVYSYLQATGIVNDHIISCFRYKEIKKL